MLRVALTGGIATGKSYVLARLATAGVPTVDADALVHHALGTDAATINAVTTRFGPSVVASDGSVNRPALGAVVFSDARARADLEAILHPHVYRLIDEWFRGLAGAPTSRTSDGPSGADPPRFGVADIPLLYETRHEGRFDRVVVAACPPDVQLERLKRRTGLTEEEARKRLAAQWPIDEKVRRADHVIDTTGTFEATDSQVDALLATLRAEARG